MENVSTTMNILLQTAYSFNRFFHFGNRNNMTPDTVNAEDDEAQQCTEPSKFPIQIKHLKLERYLITSQLNLWKLLKFFYYTYKFKIEF